MDRDDWIRIIEKCGYQGWVIRKRLRCADSTLRQNLIKHGLRLWPRFRYRTLEDWKRVLAPYDTIKDAAKDLGENYSALCDRLRPLGLTEMFLYRGRGDTKLCRVETSDLVEIYEASDRTIATTARKLGVDWKTARSEFRRRGVRCDGRADAARKVAKKRLAALGNS